MDLGLSSFIKSCGELELMVENIRQSGFKTKEGSELLMENKKALLAHFHRLNRDYAKSLTAVAETHQSLAPTVRFFVADSQNSGKEINDFFLKYPFHVSSLAFASDYGKLFGMLLHSVHKHNAVAGLIEHAEGVPANRRRIANM